MPKPVVYEMSLKDHFSQTMLKAENQANQFERTLGKTQATVMSLGRSIGLAFGGYELYQFGKSVLDTTVKMEGLNNVINFSSKDSVEAAKNHEFLRRIIDDYKLPLLETKEGFADVSSAFRGTALEGEGMRKIFDGVSVAAAVMHLDTEKTTRIFGALNKMMSTGTIQSDELRGQLAEALPGAMAIAAKSMGMTQQKFSKMVEEGKVMSADFLPKFAAMLKEEFGAGLPTALQSTQSRLNELNNKWIEFKTDLGEEVMPVISGSIDLLKEYSPQLKNIAHGVGEATVFMIKHKDAIGLVIKGYVTYRALTLTLRGIQAGLLAITGLQAAATLAQSRATDVETGSATRLTLALEALHKQQLSVMGSSALMAEAQLASSRAFDINTGAIAASGAASRARTGAAGLVSAASGAVLPVMLAAFGPGILSQLLGNGVKASDIRGGLTNPGSQLIVGRALAKATGLDEVFGMNDSAKKINQTSVFDPKAPGLFRLGGKRDPNDPLGLQAAAVARQQGKGSAGGFNMAGLSDLGSKNVKGQQIKNINVTINGGIGNNMTIETTNIREGAMKAKDIVVAGLLGAVNDSQAAD